MADAPEKPKKPAARHEAHSIHRAWRTLSTGLGLGALGAGGYAVFATKLEAGPVALLAVGFLFLVIGMSGRLPNRIKFGDNEASWLQEREAAREFVEQVVEQTNDEQRLETVSALETLNDAAPQLAAPALRALLYEDQIMTMLRQLQARSLEASSGLPTFDLVQPQNAQASALVDALLVTPGQLGVAVEIKGNSRLLTQTFRDVKARFTRLQEIDTRAKKLLVVTRAEVMSAACRELIDSEPSMRLVVVTGPQDIGVLAEAIRDALAGVSV